jgi:hypothetical protein
LPARLKTLWQDRGEQAQKDWKAEFNSAKDTAYYKAELH